MNKVLIRLKYCFTFSSAGQNRAVSGKGVASRSAISPYKLIIFAMLFTAQWITPRLSTAQVGASYQLSGSMVIQGDVAASNFFEQTAYLISPDGQ